MVSVSSPAGHWVRTSQSQHSILSYTKDRQLRTPEEMLSAEVYPLKSRNLVDDEDDEFPTPTHAELHLVFSSPAAAEQQPKCLIVRLDNTASVFVGSLIAQSQGQQIGRASCGERGCQY